MLMLLGNKMKVEFIYGTPARADLDGMFGGWLTEHQGQTFLVDCGVGSVGNTLVERLKARLDGRPLDYVLLTHIHLDHAGGLPQIFAAWPGCRVVCHAKGVRHLTDPARLWESTCQVMGELAEVYGRPGPLELGRIIPHSEADLPGVAIFETPGHAEHHLSFRVGATVFAGEVGGCPVAIDGQAFGRPATPPRFFPEITLASIDLMLEGPDGPAYFGHTPEPLPLHRTLRTYKAQIQLWLQILRHPPLIRGESEGLDDYLGRLVEEMYRLDPEMAATPPRPAAEVWVEKIFMRNAVNGFLIHFADRDRAETKKHNAA